MTNYKPFDGLEQEALLPCDVRSTDSGDLKYLSNKVIFVSKSGGFHVMNNHDLMIRRLQRGLKKWEDVVKTKIEFLQTRAYKVGLSYRPGESWKEKDITEYIKNVVDYVGRENVVAYSWVAEMQKRLEVHYYLVIITTVDCKKVPQPDKKGHWKYGQTFREEIESWNVDYMTTDYMRKKEQKSNYPKGIRTHGAWLNSKYFDAVDFWALRSVSYPGWLVEKINNAGLINPGIKRAKGGGWVVKAGSLEYFWKNEDGFVLTGRKAADFLEMEKYKYPIPF